MFRMGSTWVEGVEDAYAQWRPLGVVNVEISIAAELRVDISLTTLDGVACAVLYERALGATVSQGGTSSRDFQRDVLYITGDSWSRETDANTTIRVTAGSWGSRDTNRMLDAFAAAVERPAIWCELAGPAAYEAGGLAFNAPASV
jgi:hypothetical protein